MTPDELAIAWRAVAEHYRERLAEAERRARELELNQFPTPGDALQALRDRAWQRDQAVAERDTLRASEAELCARVNDLRGQLAERDARIAALEGSAAERVRADAELREAKERIAFLEGS